jgi:hypothetical protein
MSVPRMPPPAGPAEGPQQQAAGQHRADAGDHPRRQGRPHQAAERAAGDDARDRPLPFPRTRVQRRRLHGIAAVAHRQPDLVRAEAVPGQVVQGALRVGAVIEEGDDGTAAGCGHGYLGS